MAHEITSSWISEVIPDEDYLFLRVHQNDIDDEGNPTPSAFINRPKGSSGMSVDWSRYCTSVKTRRRGAQPAERYSVVKFTVAKARTIPDQTVIHEPTPDNRAHSEVFGNKTTEVRERFMAIYEPEIALTAPAQ